MRIEILCTGDEILTGKTINTNYSYMAQRLGEVGLSVAWGTTVGDDRESLTKAFQEASARADAVIVNGGLGPTVDDLSQEVAAEAAGVELELHEPWLEKIKGFYEARGRVMPPNNVKQAMLPVGSEFIDNPIGTACGFAVDINDTRFFFTPGVPRELFKMLAEQIIPRMLEMSGLKVVTKLKRFHSFGIGESRADQMLLGVEDLAPDGSVKLGFQSHFPQLETKLAVQAATEEELEEKLAPVEQAVRERLGNFVLSEDHDTLESRILDALRAEGATLSTMEMFTSGSIAARMIPAAGTADLIKRGVVSRDLKQLADAAGIPVKFMDREISLDNAAILAKGLAEQTGSTHSLVVLIKVDEGEDNRSLGGDIFIGIDDGKETITRRSRVIGGREWMRLGAVEMGLDCLRRHLYGLPVDERIDFEQQ